MGQHLRVQINVRPFQPRIFFNELTAGGSTDDEGDTEDEYDAEHLANIAINLDSSRQARHTDVDNVVCAEICPTFHDWHVGKSGRQLLSTTLLL